MSLNLVDVFVLYLLMQKGGGFRPIEHRDLNIFLLRHHLHNRSP